MNKKFFVVLLVLAAVFSTACRKNPDPIPTRYDVTFTSHSGDGIASYFIHRCNPIMGYCEDEVGTVHNLSIFNGSISTELLHQSGSYIILRASPGYEWVYDKGGIFSDGGFYLQKID